MEFEETAAVRTPVTLNELTASSSKTRRLKEHEEDNSFSFQEAEMNQTAAIPVEVERYATTCVDVGVDVHRVLGPGFKEVIYERAYCLELHARGVPFETEKPILVRYKTWSIPGQKIDLLVGGVLLVEIKAVPKLRRIHRLQTLSYLRTLDLRLGLLLNFGAPLMKEGIRRVVR